MTQESLMRLNLFLISIVLSASTCLGYEIVLKNGKILRGEVVRDNQELMVLKDSSGVELKIRHDQIDSAKTEERNKKVDTGASPTEQTKPSAEREETTPEKPKKKARVYTKEDLEKMPQLSIVGTDESAEEAAARNKLHAKEEENDESAWSEEALILDDEIQQAKESYEYNKSLCDRVVPELNDLMDGPYVKMTAEQYEEQRRYACAEADAAAQAQKRAEAEFEKFLERARKAGIAPGAVDPQRLRN
jgi:hypothetical protein